MITTISEEASKKRRGRPRAFTPQWLKILRDMFPDITTERGMQERAYQLQAHTVLKSDPTCRWLIDEEGISAGKPNSYRPSILAALGRIEDEDDMRAIARRICELKPNTKAAAAIVRQYRTGKASPASIESLTSILITTIDKYLAQHRDTTWEQIQQGLQRAWDAVEESKEPAVASEAA